MAPGVPPQKAVSEAQRHNSASSRAWDARPAHGPRRKHSENPYVDGAVLNRTEWEEGWGWGWMGLGGKEFRLNLQILRVRWLGFALWDESDHHGGATRFSLFSLPLNPPHSLHDGRRVGPPNPDTSAG